MFVSYTLTKNNIMKIQRMFKEELAWGNEFTIHGSLPDTLSTAGSIDTHQLACTRSSVGVRRMSRSSEPWARTH